MKKLKNLAIMGIFSLSISMVSLLVIVVLAVIFGPNYTGPRLAGDIAYIFSFLMLAAASIITITSSVMILLMDFENKKVNDSRVLWGLLSLLVLSSIGVIIFAFSSMKYIEKSSKATATKGTPKLKNAEEDNLEAVTKAFKLFKSGVITQEEFDSIKAKNI